MRHLQNLRRNEDNLVTKRGGHSTRAQVRYALHVCSGDEELSAYMLTYAKQTVEAAAFVVAQLVTPISPDGSHIGCRLPSTLQRSH